MIFVEVFSFTWRDPISVFICFGVFAFCNCCCWCCRHICCVGCSGYSHSIQLLSFGIYTIRHATHIHICNNGISQHNDMIHNSLRCLFQVIRRQNIFALCSLIHIYCYTLCLCENHLFIHTRNVFLSWLFLFFLSSDATVAVAVAVVVLLGFSVVCHPLYSVRKRRFYGTFDRVFLPHYIVIDQNIAHPAFLSSSFSPAPSSSFNSIHNVYLTISAILLMWRFSFPIDSYNVCVCRGEDVE